MPANSVKSRSASATRSRLPLTPKVVSSRRGGHVATRSARTAAAPAAPVATTPAMHVTPNVVSAARGGLVLHTDNRLTDAFKSGALDMRGLRF